MDEWCSIWESISDECPRNDLICQDSLWILLEEAMNLMNRALLLSVEPMDRKKI